MKKLYYVNQDSNVYIYEEIDEVIRSFFFDTADAKMQRVALIRIIRLWIEIFNIDINSNYVDGQNIYDLALKSDDALICLINISNIKTVRVEIKY